MMRKKTSYVNITPIPSFIPRELAIDILHSHSEIIELNPLVLDHTPIKAPRDAPADEFYSTWYEISQRIQYVPGIGKMGSSKIKFKGCFHDMPWGLQTHIYAPANVDLRNKWRIAGNQSDEPVETRELGIGAPAEGLYLREDIEIRCNVTMVSFVKKETKAASKVLVDRLIKKAELLDAGVLHAMMDDGRLRTVNPADRSSTLSPPSHPPSSPGPAPASPGYGSAQSYHAMRSPMRSSTVSSVHSYAAPDAAPPPPQPHPHPHQQPAAIMELPGDMYHAQPSPRFRSSTASSSAATADDAGAARDSWSTPDYQSNVSSRPSSFASASDGGMRSPGLDQKGFAAELPTMAETREEHDGSMHPAHRPRPGRAPGSGHAPRAASDCDSAAALKRFESGGVAAAAADADVRDRKYHYDPQDLGRLSYQAYQPPYQPPPPSSQPPKYTPYAPR